MVAVVLPRQRDLVVSQDVDVPFWGGRNKGPVAPALAGG